MTSIDSQVKTLTGKAESASDTAEAERQFREVIRLLQKLPFEQLTGSLQYALGYAWYNLPNDTIERGKNVERCFRSVISTDPTNYYAILYLGHYLFDERKYENAFNLFTQIPRRYFLGVGQGWRDLKLIELLVCCHLYLKRPVDALAALNDLIVDSCNIAEEMRPVMSELDKAFHDILLRA